jgi:hypothetical protein
VASSHEMVSCLLMGESVTSQMATDIDDGQSKWRYSMVGCPTMGTIDVPLCLSHESQIVDCSVCDEWKTWKTDVIPIS